MTYKLFIDDERFPTKPDCMIARSPFEAITMLKHYGFPKHIDFDHDLGYRNGRDETAMEVVKYIEDLCVCDNFVIPSDFTYAVHSQNPVGAKNIKARMDQLLHHYQAL